MEVYSIFRDLLINDRLRNKKAREGKAGQMAAGLKELNEKLNYIEDAVLYLTKYLQKERQRAAQGNVE